jgi:hypothetical protein
MHGFDIVFPREYLRAALIVSLLSVWVLVGLFYYLNRYTKRTYFTIWTAALLLFALPACQQTPCNPHFADLPPKPAEKPAEVRAENGKTAPPAAPLEPDYSLLDPAKVKDSRDYDVHTQAILALAANGEWEAACRLSEALVARHTNDTRLRRIHSWVTSERQRNRDQAVEDRIREINAKHSVFHPTISDRLTEPKDRGLPASKDMRDPVDKTSIERAITNLFIGSKWLIDCEHNLVEARFVNTNNLGLDLQETFTIMLGRESLRATNTALAQTGESQTVSEPVNLPSSTTDWTMNPELCRKALDKVGNVNALVNIVSRRVRQLTSGAGALSRPLVASAEHLGAADVALTEIIEDKIGWEAPTLPAGGSHRTLPVRP